MPKARYYHLIEEELAVIEMAIHHDKRPEVRQRCSAIRLLHLGHKPEQVAEMQAVSKPTIYGWIDRWRSDNEEGLANKPKSGRPLKEDDEYSLALDEGMDIASYHKSAPTLATLSLFEHRVRVIWLPPYCSELNPIERFWSFLKDRACANKLQDNIDEVVKSAEKTMTAQNNPVADLRYQVSKNL